MVTPERLLGRVSALNIATHGSRPLGAAIGALVGGLYGAETGLVVAAAGFLIQAVIILASPGAAPRRPASDDPTMKPQEDLDDALGGLAVP
jgi:hypothetical protein